MGESVDNFSDLIEAIGGLRTGQEFVSAQLTELTSSVNNLWGEVNATKRGILEHALKCPLVSRIVVLEQRAAAEVAKEVAEEKLTAHHECTRNKWEDRLWPLVWVVAAVIVGLALGHAGLFQAAVHLPGTK